MLANSVWLKINRAGEQINALGKEISEWTSRNPIKVEVKLRENRHGIQVVQKEYAENPPLERWGILVGECIHNLRSALDNLAFALARLQQDPPTNPGKIAYPICDTQAKFAASNSTSQLPPAAVTIIEQLQPFQRIAPETPAQDPLILLQQLSNTDKHRIPYVAIFSMTDWTHDAHIQFLSDEDADANCPPDLFHEAGPAGPGVILMEWKTNCPIQSAGGSLEGKGAVFLVVQSGPIPLIESLIGLQNYIGIVATQFAGFFAPSP